MYSFLHVNWSSKACERLGIKPAERILVVRIATQTLQFYRNSALCEAT